MLGSGDHRKLYSASWDFEVSGHEPLINQPYVLSSWLGLLSTFGDACLHPSK